MKIPKDKAEATVQLEPARLYRHLGSVTSGGIIEGLEPIGAASVPELAATSPVDSGLAVWPFPLAEAHQGVVASLGYTPITDYEDTPEQRFFHPHKNVRLFFVGAGSSRWTHYLLVRDFLRHSQRAWETFTDWHAQLEGDKTKATFFAALLRDAEVWWTAFHGFAPVERVAQELRAFGHPWFISSGWALELFAERVSRVHHDVDVAISRAAVNDLRPYMADRSWKLALPLDGQLVTVTVFEITPDSMLVLKTRNKKPVQESA